MNPRDPVLYRGRPATYIARYGLRHVIEIPIPHGARGTGLVYARDDEISSPTTSTGNQP